MNKNQEINAVKALGEEIGYGQLMTLASALWRQSLKEKNYPESGAFVPALLGDIKEENKDIYIKDNLNFDSYINYSTIEILKVVDVKIISPIKKERISGGTYITFYSKENLVNDSYVDIVYDNKTHHFKVVNIDIENNYLKIDAIETGYWATKFDRQNIDLRNLLNLDVTLVTDEESIKNIRTESCWC